MGSLKNSVFFETIFLNRKKDLTINTEKKSYKSNDNESNHKHLTWEPSFV